MDKVIITAIKDKTRLERSESYHYCIDSWQTWCAKNNCELLILDQPIFDPLEMKVNYCRYYCFDLLDDLTGQICLVDADTIIHPNCPNFFELTENRFCAVHNDGDYDWIIRSIENYQFNFQNEFKREFDIWKYINSGFLVFNKNHKEIIEKVYEFYWKFREKVVYCQREYGTGTDQPILNLLLNEQEIDVKLLPYQFNMQDLPRKNILDDRMLFAQIPGIYHFNGIPGGPEQSNYWMKKTYTKLFKK